MLEGMPSDAMRTMGMKSSSSSDKSQKSEGVTGKTMDSAKQGAHWVQDKASDLTDSVKNSNVTDKVSGAANSAYDWAKEKTGFGDNE
jgi:uncharacterized protein YjbJ (UPF0337 family)